MARNNEDDIHPIAGLLAIILVGGYLLWINIIKPAFEGVINWVQTNYSLIIIGVVLFSFIIGIIFYKRHREVELFEGEQNSKGLYIYVTINGETKWGSKENIKKWRDIDDKYIEENSFTKRLIQDIKDFQPTRKYKDEFPYQIELQGWLKKDYPQSKIETQTGSSRPDIIIDQVAIEIKGPTTTKDLKTIADKLLRYRIYYNHIIVVLFDVQMKDRYYNEWINGINNTYNKENDNIIIIRKG